ncbi:hypothetical protein LG634_23260 [Streptomyces bambusae]|uniref:hypothetical protein n=1 Tax=Streptomyces bambusae TaxID=1550616 RepID=UPI001CFE253C|nr:hypothetical protein [Streptomyces bambusae]MCB5167737.1 hypothetical protein [Streptomyces bambusae]
MTGRATDTTTSSAAGGVPAGFASPVSLLDEWRERPDREPLREFLVLGSAVDLRFLETVAVPQARALGARVAVLGDAAGQLHDPAEVREAGRGYLHGVASCAGGFRPGLALLIGDRACRVAIGSGSPTPAGWGADDGLWTVVATEGGASHPLLADLADWLDALPGAVGMAPWWEEHLRGLAELLTERHCEAPDVPAEGAEVRLLHNLHRPLLEQLPGGPVDELRLSAPAVDPSGAALGRLRDHFRPADVTLGLQRLWSAYEADGVRGAFAGHPAAPVREPAEVRVRHGRLIEWRTGDRWQALTGGGDLTAEGLGGAVADAAGAPCELAVLSAGPAPLLPDEGPGVPAGELTGSSAGSGGGGGAPELVLLGARADGLSFRAVLGRRPTGVPVGIEVSDERGAPGSWQRVGSIPDGVPSVVIALPTAPEPGAAVRAVAARPDGPPVTSAVAFLYGVEPAAPGGHLSHGYTAEDLIADPAAARRFETDVMQLRELPAAGPSAAPRDLAAALAVSRRTLGPALTHLAFGPLSGELPGPAETPEELSGGADGDGPAGLPVEVRTHGRTWMGRLVRQLAADTRAAQGGADGVAEQPDGPQGRVWSLPAVLALSGLHLRLLAAGAWDEDDYGWRDLTAELIAALTAVAARAEVPEPADAPDGADPGDGVPDDGSGAGGGLWARVDAVVAVHMSLLGLHYEIEGPEADAAAAASWRSSRAAVARARTRHAADLFLPAAHRGAPVATDSDLRALRKRAQAVPDPVGEAVKALAAAGLHGSYEGGVWELREVSNPQGACAKAVTVVSELPDGLWPGPVFVRATGRGVPCFMAWHRPTLIRRAGRAWSSHRILPPATPSATFQRGSARPTATGDPASRDLHPLLEAAEMDPVELFLRLNADQPPAAGA